MSTFFPPIGRSALPKGNRLPTVTNEGPKNKIPLPSPRGNSLWGPFSSGNSKHPAPGPTCIGPRPKNPHRCHNLLSGNGVFFARKGQKTNPGNPGRTTAVFFSEIKPGPCEFAPMRRKSFGRRKKDMPPPCKEHKGGAGQNCLPSPSAPPNRISEPAEIPQKKFRPPRIPIFPPARGCLPEARVFAEPNFGPRPTPPKSQKGMMKYRNPETRGGEKWGESPRGWVDQWLRPPNFLFVGKKHQSPRARFSIWVGGGKISFFGLCAPGMCPFSFGLSGAKKGPGQWILLRIEIGAVFLNTKT